VPYALRDQSPAPGTTVRIEVTGPGEGSWAIRRQDSTWAVDRDSSRPAADALVQLSSDTLWRVATRGITVESARERATIAGDQVLGSAVLTLVSIIR
jgi:hypothetical protein